MPLVGEIMTDDCQCVGERQAVRDAAQRMAELKIGAMPICGDDGRLKGMITDRDITVKIVAAGKDPTTTGVLELAEGTPIWVEADADVDYARELMAEHDVRRLPVIEDKRLVGIISQADIARQTPAEQTGDLVAAISASPPNNWAPIVPNSPAASGRPWRTRQPRSRIVHVDRRRRRGYASHPPIANSAQPTLRKRPLAG